MTPVRFVFKQDGPSGMRDSIYHKFKPWRVYYVVSTLRPKNTPLDGLARIVARQNKIKFKKHIK